ncbi:MAG: IclR family transcriptional regulator [Clostridia bacterium]|nr:IclR family transcriptional regulator [Clostridia bacterium]
MPRPSPLKTVDEALELLLAIARNGGAWTPSRAAAAFGLPKSNAHRLLAALAERGFLVRDRSARAYRLGLAAWMVGQAAREELGFPAVRGVLTRLAAESGESAFFNVRQGRSAVAVEKVESQRHPLRLTMELGAVAPLHAGASQRVILAHLPEPEREAYLAGPLEAMTPRTLVDPEALRAELARIRERGYDVSRGHLTPGVTAVAAPVFGTRGEVVASVSLGGPDDRLDDAAVSRFAELVRQAAAELSLAPDAAGS